MEWELRTGEWETALADVGEVDAIIADPPYSWRTHDGHDDGANMANRAGEKWARSNGGLDIVRPRRSISYSCWGADEVNAFVEAWAPRCRGWFVVFSDSDLCLTWREAFESVGLTGFQPLPVLIPGMTVRMSGDGPSSWAVYVNVARPKVLCRWGTTPGGYHGAQGEREHIGGKPEWLMRALVRDYTRAGDVVCDPCAGMGTTLLAAAIEGRRAIGAEVNSETAAKAIERIKKGYTPDIFSPLLATKQCARCGGHFRLGAFGVDRSSRDNKQSWCRRCKAEWEFGPENTWKRVRVWLEKEEPKSIAPPHGWTEAEYLRRWKEADGKCTLCGAGLREWQGSGHNLDRIDNGTPHTPANCRLVCWPCNKKKSNDSPLVADEEIRRQVEKFGWGQVPWQVLYPGKWERIELPDVEPFRVTPEPAQLAMFTAGGAK